MLKAPNLYQKTIGRQEPEIELPVSLKLMLLPLV
jgi:hypothetical protein